MNETDKTKRTDRLILLFSVMVALMVAAIVIWKPFTFLIIFGTTPILLVAGLLAFRDLISDVSAPGDESNTFEDWKTEPYRDPANGSSQIQPGERYKASKKKRKPSAIRTHRRSLTERTHVSDRGPRLLDR